MTEYRVSGVVAQGAERGIVFSDAATFTLATGRRSAYDGLVLQRFDRDRGFMAIKLLDEVHFEDAGGIEHVTVEQSSLIVEYSSGLVAVFTLEGTSRSTTLQVQTSKPATGTIRFDVRHVYDSIPFHKIYALEPIEVRHGAGFALSFRKSSEGDQRFDIEQELRFACFGREVSIERIDSWPHLDDPFDAARGQSEGHYAYEPVRFSACETIVVTTRKTPKHLASRGIGPSIGVDRRSAAIRAAETQLRGSLLRVGSNPRVLAGFPWFFQEWSRDAAISIGGLRAVASPAERVRILLRLARSLATSEESIQSDSSSLRSADAAGLVYARLAEETLDAKTKKVVAKLLVQVIEADEERMRDGLVTNGALETWMDTGSGFRAGACVEIQALHARMLSFAHELTGDESYSQRLATFIDAVRARLIRGDGRIVDHIDEHSVPADHVAPNQFLAYVFYPGLFEEGTWRWSFDHALEVLAPVDPGRLASIEPSSPLYCAFHTGADNRSYHRGDSWLFVNHLAALSLARLDRAAYGDRIEAIVNASMVDCFERGAFCAFSEVSSAQRQDSNGCWAQTWSAATFLELMSELER